MAKTGYKVRGRAFRGSGLSSARLIRRMVIWIYDKHTILAKAGGPLSGSNALFVVDRLATS